MIAEQPQTYAEMVAADRAATLDDLLSRWHSWQGGFKATRGFKGKALVVGDFRISRQYDSDNGALDDDLENLTMGAVDFQVAEMVDPYRAALYAQARELCTGIAVWTSARLSSDKAEREATTKVARQLLTTRLVSSGVME